MSPGSSMTRSVSSGTWSRPVAGARSGAQTSAASPTFSARDVSLASNRSRSAARRSGSFAALRPSASRSAAAPRAAGGTPTPGGGWPRSSGPTARWSVGSKARSESISSPKNSIRTGSAADGGKTSTMPPRRANSPRPATSEDGRVAEIEQLARAARPGGVGALIDELARRRRAGRPGRSCAGRAPGRSPRGSARGRSARPTGRRRARPSRRRRARSARRRAPSAARARRPPRDRRATPGAPPRRGRRSPRRGRSRRAARRPPTSASAAARYDFAPCGIDGQAGVPPRARPARSRSDGEGAGRARSGGRALRSGSRRPAPRAPAVARAAPALRRSRPRRPRSPRTAVGRASMSSAVVPRAAAPAASRSASAGCPARPVGPSTSPGRRKPRLVGRPQLEHVEAVRGLRRSVSGPLLDRVGGGVEELVESLPLVRLERRSGRDPRSRDPAPRSRPAAG